MGKISQFYKTILLIIMSIGFFLGLKYLLPDRLFPEKTTNDSSMLIDSVLLEALGDNSLSVDELSPVITDSFSNVPIAQTAKDSMNTASIKSTSSTLLALKSFKRSNFSKKLEKRKPFLFIPDDNQFVTESPIVDTLLDPTISIQGYGYLQRFFAKLNKIRKTGSGKTRVAYFGDSMNDGDFIVQDIRALFQEEYGGHGVGFVAITSKSANSRGSVYHKHSDNWNTQSFITVKSPTTPFGVDGQVFTARDAGTYWASYTAGNSTTSPSLYTPTLFYGKSDNQNAVLNVKMANGGQKQLSLKPKKLLNTLFLEESYTRTVHATFSNLGDIPIYGFDFASSTGVHVDNFSLRGNSGLTLGSFNTSLMNAFDRILNYDLIILQFGTNVLNYGSSDYSFYEKGMTASINKLRLCFPNADILVISTADKGKVTDPAVVPLMKSQKNLSRQVGAGFIDLYNLMGGENSMNEWVSKQLGNTDYTHFSIKGSKEIGNLLYREIHKGFEKYQSQLEKDIKRKEQIE